MNELSIFIEDYEMAQAVGHADLADFLPDPGHRLYPAVLRELVRVDLEYGWNRSRPRPLEEYRQRFPQLFQEPQALQELAFEEYRLRLLAGEKPSAVEYQQRFQVKTHDWPGQDAASPAGAGIAPDNGQVSRDLALENLDLLLKDLQSCNRMAEQVLVTLEAIRESIQADAVFVWHPDCSQGALETAGKVVLSRRWCEDFGTKIIKEHAGVNGQIFLPTLPPAPGIHTAESAIFLRLSKSQHSWIVALSLNAGRHFVDIDVKIMILARRMLLNQRQSLHTFDKLKNTLFSLIRCLTATIDARDPYTCGHSERVARIAVRLAKQMGLPGRALSDIYLSGLLHDIGKIGINDQVLQKPGKLTPEEYAHVQEHPLIGDRILATVSQLASLRPGVRNHHERYDGKGYPDRLAGKDIALQARVLAVADACDAMMAARPYRPAMPPEQIDATMAQGAGIQWDPAIIGHFMACRHELYPICQRGIGRSVFQAVEQTLQPTDDDSAVVGLSNTDADIPDD